MPERLFYIGGEWLTYEQAHRLGYTLRPPKILTLYTVNHLPVKVRKDIDTNQYYDSENLRWVNKISELNLYKYVAQIDIYRGEASSKYKAYSSEDDDNADYILYNNTITLFENLYNDFGLTKHECSNYIVSNDVLLVWHDSRTGKYFDDRESRHLWTDVIHDVEVTSYDSFTNTSRSIYEDNDNDVFFIDDHFISRSEFYSLDNKGIIRETKTAYSIESPNDVRECYYDTYSEEYCIPNVTSTWMSAEDILNLGWVVLDALAEFWKCVTPLYLLWKYLPNTVVVSFICSQHPELHIPLPLDQEVTIGDSIMLPDLSGIYSDDYYHKYSAVSWDIGEFNEEIVIEESTVANLLLEPVFATVHFTNETHPEFVIDLPLDMTVETGSVIVLPNVQGRFRDDDFVNWSPSSWGDHLFNSQFLVTDDVSLDLTWVVINTYNVIDETSGSIIHSGQSVVVTSCIHESVIEQSSLEYASITPKVIAPNNLTYSTILPTIISGNRLVIRSAESIPPADLVVYNEDTDEVTSSIFKKDVVTFSTSHLVVGNPNTEIVFGSTSFITLDNALEDIVIAQADHFTVDGSDLQTILVKELPTVSTSGDFGDYNILTANTSGGSTMLSPSDSWVPYIGGTTSTANYNDSFTYATVNAYDSNLDEVDRTSLGYFNTNPSLGWRNIGTSAIEVRQAKVAVCHSTVDVITVYNVSSIAYNAFKYTEDGADYYYVLDSLHTSWTNDLASIGYSNVYLPHVFSYTGTQTSSSISPDASFDTGLAWDANKLYIGETNDGQGNITRYGWKAEALPHVFSYTNTQTSTSVAAGESFDTGLEWDSSKSYIGETNDEHGNVTRYGWESTT